MDCGEQLGDAVHGAGRTEGVQDCGPGPFPRSRARRAHQLQGSQCCSHRRAMGGPGSPDASLSVGAAKRFRGGGRRAPQGPLIQAWAVAALAAACCSDAGRAHHAGRPTRLYGAQHGRFAITWFVGAGSLRRQPSAVCASSWTWPRHGSAANRRGVQSGPSAGSVLDTAARRARYGGHGSVMHRRSVSSYHL